MCWWALLVATAWATPVTVTVTGAPTSDGQILMSVWCDPDGWLDAAAGCRQAGGPTIGAGAVLTVDLAPGTYALSAFHDADGDGVMRVSWPIPIPKDPVAVSNNPKPRLGPPTWTSAVFVVGDAPVAMTITLVTP